MVQGGHGHLSIWQLNATDCSNYYRNYIEVVRLPSLSSKVVIKIVMEIFARYGVADTVVTDNGPQFSGANFARFAQSWGFEHVTSSPHFAVKWQSWKCRKNHKTFVSKVQIDNMFKFVALLNWRNTPSKGLEVSPSQHLFDRRCKTLLPIIESLLKPRYALAGEILSMRASKVKQAYYYNRHVKSLKPLNHGDIVCMCLPLCLNNNKEWLGSGLVLGQVALRLFEVEINRNVYCRNQCHLLAPQCSLEEGIAILPSKGEVTIEKQDQQQHKPQQSMGVVLDSNHVDARTLAGDVSELVMPVHRSECAKSQAQQYGFEEWLLLFFALNVCTLPSQNKSRIPQNLFSSQLLHFEISSNN